MFFFEGKGRRQCQIKQDGIAETLTGNIRLKGKVWYRKDDVGAESIDLAYGIPMFQYREKMFHRKC